jgi:hypothetical protein
MLEQNDPPQQPQPDNSAVDSECEQLVSSLNEPLNSTSDLDNQSLPNAQCLANRQVQEAKSEDADSED